MSGRCLPLGSYSTDFALCLEAIPMATADRLHHHDDAFSPPDARGDAGQCQGGLPLSEQRPHDARGQGEGFHNALVCDTLGNVAELATSNVFMVRGGEVFTPVPNGTFLDGITRQRVIAPAARGGRAASTRRR